MAILGLARVRLLAAAAVLGIAAALVCAFAGGSGVGPGTAHAQGYPQTCAQAGYVFDGYQCVYVGITVPGETCMPGYNGGVTCSGPVNWANWSQSLYPFGYGNTLGYPFGYNYGYPFGANYGNFGGFFYP